MIFSAIVIGGHAGRRALAMAFVAALLVCGCKRLPAFLSPPRPEQIAVAFGPQRENCARMSDGSVRCWGGLAARAPTAIPGLDHVVRITTAGARMCAWLADKTLRCTGDGTTQGGLEFVPVPGITQVVDLALTATHACAALIDGSVRCWGHNTDGQLGDGTTQTRVEPVLVSGVKGAVQVVASRSHTCARLADSTAQCWGKNQQGQLGDRTRVDSSLPHVVAGLAGATQIAVSEAFGCALLDDRSIRCWGSIVTGPREREPNITLRAVGDVSTAAALAVAPEHACAIFGGGSVACWGEAFDSRFGDVPPVVIPGLSSIAHIEVSSLGTCAWSNGGPLSCWGLQKAGGATRALPATIDGVANITQVAMGYDRMCALTSGAVQCWGPGVKATRDGKTTGRSDPAAVAFDVASNAASDATSPLRDTASTQESDAGAPEPVPRLVVAISSPVRSMAADESGLYWSDQHGDIVKHDHNGRVTTILATDQGGPTAVTLDAHYVYWANSQSRLIMMVPKGGGRVVPIARTSESPFAIAVGSDWIYWAAGTTNLPATIHKVHGAGQEPTLVADWQWNVHSITVGPGGLYWIGSSGGSDRPTSVRLEGATPRSPFEIDGSKGSARALVVDASGIYWVAAWRDETFCVFGGDDRCERDRLGWMRVAHEGAAVTTLGTADGDPRAIAVSDRDAIYWAAYEMRSMRAAVWKMAKTGGVPVRIVSMPEEWHTFALDEDSLYLATRAGIFAVPK